MVNSNFITILQKIRIAMGDRIRIKDIAAKAGVSVGTVDRVLHKRPNVSKLAKEKVEKILNEINYQPNVYASVLAYNKPIPFIAFCLNTQAKLIGKR